MTLKMIEKFTALFKPKPAIGDGRDTRAITLLLMCLMAVAPEMAVAEPWDDIAEKIVDVLTGGFARTCAILVVAFCGYRWWAGRLNMEVAGSVIGGIVLIFGAVSIVDFVSA